MVRWKRGGPMPCTRVLAVATLLGSLVVSRPALAQAQLPACPPGWVADAASVLTPQEIEALEAEIARAQSEQSVRLVVLTLADSQGEDPKIIGRRVLNDW